MNESLDYYRIFYEVARLGNITKASETLFISQPAISMTIKNLEEELGVKLFVRSRQGVTLTKVGEKVFKSVQLAMSSLNKIKDIIDEEKNLLSGEIIIGCGSNLARQVLVKPIKEFLERFPQIKIVQFEEVQTKMFEMLEHGEIDLIISQFNGTNDSRSFSRLAFQPYVFVKSPNSNSNYLITMTKGSFAYSIFNEFIEKCNLQSMQTIPVSGYNLALDLAINGVGITLCPLYLAQNYIDEGKLEITYRDYPLPNIELGFYHNPLLLSPATKEFVKLLNLK